MISKRKSRRDSRPDDDANLDDPCVIAAVKQYMAALEAGKPIARREFLARHADIADDLIPCLDGLELVYQVAKQMHKDANNPPWMFAGELLPLPLIAH